MAPLNDDSGGSDCTTENMEDEEVVQIQTASAIFKDTRPVRVQFSDDENEEETFNDIRQHMVDHPDSGITLRDDEDDDEEMDTQ